MHLKKNPPRGQLVTHSYPSPTETQNNLHMQKMYKYAVALMKNNLHMQNMHMQQLRRAEQAGQVCQVCLATNPLLCIHPPLGYT